MKTILLILTIIALYSCAPRYSLQGKYQDVPYAIPTTKSTDTTWLQVIDYLTQQGITPKFIKKNKSLLITDTISFKQTYTTENSSGQLMDSSRYVVLPKLGDDYQLRKVTAYWTINIHSKRKRSAVLIQLSKVTATFYQKKKGFITLIGNHVSTGYFENNLKRHISHN